ncbi:response regulator [Cellulomonas sp. P5_C6]
MTTVLVVDDADAFRDAVSALLESDGFDVVGQASTGADGVLLGASLRPEIVLLDVRLPDTTGFEVAELLARLVPAPRVVLVSSAALTRRLDPALVVGFVPKAQLTPARVRALLEAG